MNKIILRHAKNAFFISLAYVGLGTISVLSMYPGSPLFGNWVIFAVLVTLPVNFISVGIMYTDSTAFGIVIVVQLVYFLLFWFLLYRVMKRRHESHGDIIS